MASELKTVQVDERGRITIPKEMRDRLDVHDGDTIAIQQEDATLRLVKMESPFEVLAEHARKEHQAGRTRTIREPGE